MFVMSKVCYILGLLCLVYVCLGLVMPLSASKWCTTIFIRIKAPVQSKIAGLILKVGWVFVLCIFRVEKALLYFFLRRLCNLEDLMLPYRPSQMK